MPIAYNPWLEANQSEGKVSIKQSQALSLIPSCSFSSSHLSTRCLSFIFAFNPALLFSVPHPLSAFRPLCLPAAGQGMGPEGGDEGRIPSTTGLVTDKQGPSSHSYSTRYFPGKHLLCSLAQKLASNIAHPNPNSCLVMPIKNLHKLWFKRWNRMKEKKKKRLNRATERDVKEKMAKGGIREHC